MIPENETLNVYFQDSSVTVLTGDSCTVVHIHRDASMMKSQQILDPLYCEHCLKKCFTNEGDHDYPIAFGGSTSHGNIRWLCRECHSVKTEREMLIRSALRKERLLKGSGNKLVFFMTPEEMRRRFYNDYSRLVLQKEYDAWLASQPDVVNS